MKNEKIAFFIGITLLVLVFIEVCLWIGVSVKYDNFEDSSINYLSYFPEMLRNRILITVVRILFVSISSTMLIYCVNKSFLKITSAILLCFSFLLFLWSMYTLM